MKRTSWWTQEFSHPWSRVKAAFHRDWLQTQRHFGASHCFDLKQGFKNTILQIIGRQAILVGPNLKRKDQAHRFGAAARHHYADIFPKWSDEAELELRAHWGPDWDKHQAIIRLGWESQMPQVRQQPDRAPKNRKLVDHGVRFDPAESGR